MSAETVEWLENDIAGNLFVSSGAKVMGMGNHAPFPARVGSRLRAVPGVQTAVGIRFALLPFRETRSMVLGVDLEPFGRMNRVQVRGIARATALDGMLQNGDALVSENFARIHGLEIGDSVEFPGLRGSFEVRICGLFRDYSWPRGTVLLDRRLLERHLDDALVDEFSLVLDDEADEAAVIEGIEAATGSDLDLVVTSADDLRASARQMLGDFFSISYAQVAVAMVVAFLGVLNALWIAVLLRRRELSLLRAVGATRRQVVTSVFVQAIALGLLGGLLGVTGGLVVQWVVIQRVMPAETGWVYAVRVPLLTLGATFLLSIVASAIAGILPARLAAQTPLQEALGDE
jgi:putative ABC transport system permease protein